MLAVSTDIFCFINCEVRQCYIKIQRIHEGLNLEGAYITLTHILNGKGKVHPRTGHEGPKTEQRYSSTLSLTSTIDEGGWSRPCPGYLTVRNM